MTVARVFPLLNREISRLDYNRRVLAKARDNAVPLIERLRFLTYASRNLEEFFMVRVGATRDLLDAGITERTPDGLTPSEQMTLIRRSTTALLDELYECLGQELLPQLERHGVTVETFPEVSPVEQEELRAWFRGAVLPLLTPLAIDPGHPFPFVANLSLNIMATVESSRTGENVVLIKIPSLLGRFRPIGNHRRFVPIGSIIRANLETFFPGFTIRKAFLFRTIRNSELALDDDEVRDLRDSVEAELRRRDRKQVVSLEVDAQADEALVRILIEGTRARPDDLYRVPGFLKIGDFSEICDRVTDAGLNYPEFNPRLPKRLATSDDIFAIIARGDVLLHRPYESFTAVVEFLHAAATDPSVVAIKQTLYQTDEDSPVVEKLALAATNGKQVTVIIELQARFEEQKNIAWAQRLADAGVQIVYGLVGVQTHAKLALVVRSEGGRLRHYVHLATGNYNADAAGAYTDLDLLTSLPSIGREASQLINVLTGYSARTLQDVFEQTSEGPKWEHFVLAPFAYHRWLLERIDREAKYAAAGKPAGIVAKLNSLVDPQIIQALYDASNAGVKIDLIVRSMCCLLPGLPDVSENIRVMSIVDRFLEHSRIIRFTSGGTPETFLSSGDWMPRNFRRIELVFPLLDPAVQDAASQILDLTLGDTASSWTLRADGTWQRRGGAEGMASQKAFIDIVRAEALSIGPYEKTLQEAPRFRGKARRSKRG